MNRIAKFEKVSEMVYLNNYHNGSEIKKILSDLKLPKRATKGSAGYDFFAPFDIDIAPGENMIIPTGIRAKISDGWVLMMFPRSGHGFKYGIKLANTVGIIDADFYRPGKSDGHILIKLENPHPDKHFHVDKGAAFAQGIFVPFGITEDDEVNDERTGGFGSTDKR